MSAIQRYTAGVLREQWTNGSQATDPTPVGYTTFDATGAQTATRALTAAEAQQLAAQDATLATSNNDAVTSQLMTTGMARLTQIINQGNTLSGQSTAWTVAQQKLVAQAMADLAQIDRYIIRKVLGILDATN